MMNRHGQISTEYLILIGFITFLVLGILSAAALYTSASRDQVRFSNLDLFSSKVISTAETVYYEGEPSLRTINVYLPSGVQSVTFDDEGMTISLLSDSGDNLVHYTSEVPLAGSISSNEGVKRLRIEVQPGRAFISEE